VIYEECLKQLPPEDIAKLGRILERMAEELKKVKG
jgi:diadenosine tetraphosphate (Ap4A) HIT family hydrolase